MDDGPEKDFNVLWGLIDEEPYETILGDVNETLHGNTLRDIGESVSVRTIHGGPTIIETGSDRLPVCKYCDNTISSNGRSVGRNFYINL